VTAWGKLSRKRYAGGAYAFGVVALYAGRALAHGSMSLDEERLSVGLVALSFAMIAAFVYLVAKSRRDRGREA